MAKINFTEILVNTGGAVAGGVAGGMLKKLPVSGVVANGAGVLVGAILPVIAPKNALIKSVATGIAAVAGRNLVSSFVPAIGDDFDSSVGITDDALGDVYYEEPETMEADVTGVPDGDLDD